MMTNNDNIKEHMYLMAEIRKNGYAVRSFRDYSDFLSQIDCVGKTVNKTDVLVDSRYSAQLTSQEAMSAHTDDASVDIIAWYCQSPASEGGESVCVDTRRLPILNDPVGSEKLTQIMVKRPREDDWTKAQLWPLLNRRRVYYAPWLVDREGLREEQEDLLGRFEKELGEVEKYTVKLGESDALFIDNRRILHGRNSFSENESVRRLVRHWVVI